MNGHQTTLEIKPICWCTHFPGIIKIKIIYGYTESQGMDAMGMSVYRFHPKWLKRHQSHRIPMGRTVYLSIHAWLIFYGIRVSQYMPYTLEDYHGTYKSPI